MPTPPQLEQIFAIASVTVSQFIREKAAVEKAANGGKPVVMERETLCARRLSSTSGTSVHMLPWPEEQVANDTKSDPLKVVTRSWWAGMIAAVGALLLAAGGFIALTHPGMLVAPDDAVKGAVRVYANYFASRNLALALLIAVLLLMGARRSLGSMLVLTALIQVLDACLDVMDGRLSLVPGVLVLGIAFLLAAARLSGSPFWKRSAWD
jgi:hypothetical protein